MKKDTLKLASAAALAGLTLMGVAQPAMAATVDMGYVAKDSTKGQGYYDVKKNLVKLDTTGRVNYVPGYGILVWSKPGNEPTKRYLAHGSSWKVFGYVTDANGHKWYNLGGSQWVDSSYIVLSNSAHTETTPTTKESTSTKSTTTTSTTTSTAATGVLKINYRPGYGVMLWATPGAHALNRYLPHGSSWKFFAKSEVNGHTWYNLGGNQWVDGSYAVVNGQQNTVNAANTNKTNNSKFDVAANSILKVENKQGLKVYTSPNGKETSQVLPAGTRWKVFRELNNGELWMQLGSNQWVNTASNVAK